MIRRLLRACGHALVLMLLASVFAPAALAATPSVEESVETGTYILPCSSIGFDFDIQADYDERLTIRTFYDKSGNAVRIQIHVKYRGSLTNLKTGFSVADHANYTVVTDLKKGTDSITGVYYNLIVPGVGPIFQQIGHVVFDSATGTVIFSAGPNDLFEGDPFPAVCGAMNR